LSSFFWKTQNPEKKNQRGAKKSTKLKKDLCTRDIEYNEYSRQTSDTRSNDGTSFSNIVVGEE